MKHKGKTRYPVIATALIVLSCLLPCPDGLTRACMQSFGIMMAAIVLWITEAIFIPAACTLPGC